MSTFTNASLIHYNNNDNKTVHKHHRTFSLSSHSVRQLSFLFPLSWSSVVLFSRQMLNAHKKPERAPRMVTTVP